MNAPTPGDVPAALLNAALRVRQEARRVRWLTGLVGEGTTLPAEVDQALKALVAWAGRVAAGTVPNTHTPPPAAAETVEPGPLAARPRPRHPMRRSKR